MNKRIWTSVVAMVILFAMALPALSAPLFPDVPENHWARDAVARLAAKGLVEGYPDGTFKGDRAATRWEVAMIVARLLAKMEEEHATFATKAELNELRQLVNALREELDALGVRVTNLEENVSRLDQRVTELERITFYGSVDTRMVAQNFVNNGQSTNDNGILGAGAVDYNQAVGSANAGFPGIGGLPGVQPGGAALSPFHLGAHPDGSPGESPYYGSGAFPVVDLTNGRPLSNGTGFTMRAILGLRIRVTDDIDAGAEFSAFTSQGDAVVDAFWGVSAPYLSNPFTGDINGGGIAGVQGLNNQPYTRMTLDNFWVLHNPSGTKLTLGAYNTDNMDDILFVGQYNPNAFGPEFLDRFGFNVNGSFDIKDTGVMRWEVLGSRMGDGMPAGIFGVAIIPGNVGYVTDVLGADLAFEFKGGQVKANFMRAANEAAGGNALAVGGIIAANVNYGNSFGMTPLQWVNPSGYYAAQTSAFAQANGGFGTTVDNRPIPGWNPAADVAGQPYIGGSFGPQSMFGYGLSADYKWDIGGGDTQIYVAGEWAHTEYKSNRNSDYSSDGDAGRFEVGANLLEGDLDVSLAYLTVDPTYDPFINAYPSTSGNFTGAGVWRLPDLNYFSNMWAMHDTDVYPHNREGITFNGQWRFMERRGLVWAKAEFLNQKETSLYDVRVLPGAAGAGAPTAPIVGFAPGWIDPVFFGYAHPSIYGAGTASSFNDALQPLEDNRGKQTAWGLGVSYKFDNPRIKIDLGYERNDFKRETGLTAAFGGSQNYTKIGVDSGHFGLGWEANDQWTLRGGVDIASIKGHWDPGGIYNTFAVANNTTGFNNIDVTQTIPFIGFDYDISANTQWNMDFRYYDNNDNVDATTFAGPTTQAGTPLQGFTAHPLDWSGWQVTTQFKVKF